MDNPSGTNRACAACSRTKVKCVPNQDGMGACQRCQRLHQPCEPFTPKVRSQTRKRRPVSTLPASQQIVERLEQKLDTLVSLVESTHEIVSQPRGPPSSVEHVTSSVMATQSVDYTDPTSQSPQTSEHLASNIHVSSYTPAGLSSSSEPQFSDPILSNAFMPDSEGANALLNVFKSQMSPHFPFITIPEMMSAAELFREKPLLYISILAIASRESTQQKGLGELFIREYTKKMFLNCERSLDLLLGVLTYAGWCYSHLWNVPQFTNLLCAATTLVCDLGLSQRTPQRSTRKSPFDDALRATCAQIYRPSTKEARTLEEQRAFLGCFFLSSVASLSFRKIHSYIRHSPYVDDCVRYVEDFGDCPSDKSLVAMVKLQIITERIYQSPWHSNVELYHLDTGTIFLVDMLQRELKHFAESLLPEQANNSLLLMHYHVAEIAVFEAGTHRSQLATDVIPNLKHLELLSACLRACASYFNTFFLIPVVDYVTLPLPTWSRLTHSLAILHFLSEFDSPGWSLTYVRETIDFVTVLSQVSERLDSVDKFPGYEHFDIFSPTAKRLNCIKLYIEGKSGRELAGNKGPDPNTDLNSAIIPRTDDLSTFFQYLDDNWMGDMPEPPDLGLAMHFSV